jgi:hypothetical protein
MNGGFNPSGEYSSEFLKLKLSNRMIFIKLLKSIFSDSCNCHKLLRSLIKLSCLTLLIFSLSFSGWWTSTALATIDDDRYEGNIFVLFGGNGSLVPPRMDLATSLKRDKPAILVFYIDDSSDCKRFAGIVTRMQEFYGRAASIIPVTVDSLITTSKYTPEEAGYYYKGVVPQTVVLDQQGKVVYNGRGVVPYEEVDDALREVFELLPRSESQVLKRRSFNEFNSGMTD